MTLRKENVNEEKLIKKIRSITEKNNIDNISRTIAYLNFFNRNSEITWAYLASMVSRNAGWNMSDLHSKPFKRLLSEEDRHHLFITYERANWMIFSDAFPQLLLYEQSKKLNKPLFSLLLHFNVSTWMIQQWEYFWKTKNEEVLIQAQIINEQHLIQNPIIESPFFNKKIFQSAKYLLQERLHFSVVIFPTMKGEVYGRSVKKFTLVHKRVELGKQLASILLNSPERKAIKSFSNTVTHTGSRFDYQRYQKGHFSRTPMVRSVYPTVIHMDNNREDWFNNNKFQPDTLLKSKLPSLKNYHLTEWYKKKQQQIAFLGFIKAKLFM